MTLLHALADRIVGRLVPTVPAAAMPPDRYTYVTCSNVRCAIFWNIEYEITCGVSVGGCYVSRYIGCGC